LLDARGDPRPIEALPARRVLAGEPAAMAILRYRVRGKLEERWSEVRASPVRDAEGNVRLAVNVFRDVTARRRWEEWQRLLTSAGDTLAHSLEFELSIERVAQLAVPHLADWCAVDLLNDDGSIQSAAVAHADPGKLEVLRRLRADYPPDPDAPRGTGAVVR